MSSRCSPTHTPFLTRYRHGHHGATTATDDRGGEVFLVVQGKLRLSRTAVASPSTGGGGER